MSFEQYQRSVNTMDKEIADLEKKKSDADKKYAEFQSKISAAQKSITKNTSPATLRSKMRQIEGWQADSARKSKESADLGKKIADKRKRRNDEVLKLQKAQQVDQKKQDKQLKTMRESYDKRIEDLMQQATSLGTVSVIPVPKSESIPDIEEYDVFISHAWEDKKSFVDEFVQALTEIGIKVWYDKERIKWGDSMRAKIDNGLRKSRFGVAVLSPNYIAKNKYWTKAELDGLFQLESINGKMLLPIWHNLTKKEVMEYSPTIASKLAMTTASMTAQEIAAELKNLLDDPELDDN